MSTHERSTKLAIGTSMTNLTSEQIDDWLLTTTALLDNVVQYERQLNSWLKGDGNYETVVLQFYLATAKVARHVADTARMLHGTLPVGDNGT